MRSFETTAEPAFGRIQDKATGKGIKGLVVEFYDHDGEFTFCWLHWNGVREITELNADFGLDCLDFWKECSVKEIMFSELPPAAMD